VGNEAVTTVEGAPQRRDAPAGSGAAARRAMARSRPDQSGLRLVSRGAAAMSAPGPGTRHLV